MMTSETPLQFEDYFRPEELREDLARYLQKIDGVGECLRHPLLYAVPYLAQMNAYYNQAFTLREEMLRKAQAEKRWSGIVAIVERPWRLHYFADFAEELSDRQYWEILGELWTDSENIHQNIDEWKAALRSPRAERDAFMSEEDRHTLKTLPDKLTVYRGYIRGRNERGLSYTLDWNRAHFFANRFRRKTETARVKTRHVKKADVFAFMNSRGEQEVIILPAEARK
jgi:hypothetical protein